ncbi:16S rRNA (adenine(1518)-N(6)/adenine(1519)-N(6))-dimethyltransferase RsmA [Mycoplasmopsis agassizii]|uniref:16S rRNA (adenine(1518)-N(6)/adenine(1519)-N(6))- dimethyltransferase RsmA n=1 Tax=Mycoplasmopsis agassizii TaxID=33922 RepID=UPI0035296181
MKAKKSLGQNFLISQKSINKIIKSVDFETNNILEIGPGKGALTKELIKYAKHLKVYEIDNDLIPYLKHLFEKDVLKNHLEIIHQDFLEANFDNSQKYNIVANIPYYITSQILFKIIENYVVFEQITIMVQKEVGERILATESTSEYSKLSVSLQMLYDIELVSIVPANHFNPVPKVDSMVIKLIKNELPENFEINEFLNVVKTAFQFKRKTLWNNLKTVLDYNEYDLFCQQNDLSLTSRAQSLSVDKFLNLYYFIKEKNASK